MTAIKTFAQLYGAEFPKTVKKIGDDEAEAGVLRLPGRALDLPADDQPEESLRTLVR
ncbi:hypothetical protein ACH4ND_03640 [Streptomyces sp. NPDC017179]|uniref:hypothetical protein n=1 Tax=Streptomyces sp. NPDC017179 TaxID=3364979 RepID=UPI003798C1E4